MPPVNLYTPASSTNITQVFRGSSNQEDQDIWLDTIDHGEMEETWYDAREELYAGPSSSVGEAADSRVPFTEDCRRSVQQFVRALGEWEESKLLSACLSRILPGAPTSLVIAANSLYTAITERRNIDTATVHALGLASLYLPDNINVVSQLAAFIRDTITGWTDDTFLQQFLSNEENHTAIHLSTALAVTAIIAGRWMNDAGSPQRGLLKVPAFMANILIRASHYWAALGNMASNLPSSAGIPENSSPSRRPPAFEVNTRVDMTKDVCDTLVPCTPSTPRLIAFSSNSTANPEAYTKGIVQSRLAAPEESYPLLVPEQLHYLAVDKLRQESGLADLLYCTTRKTETRQQANEKAVTTTHFNTKCDATVYPAPLMEATGSTSVYADRPEIQVSSPAAGRSNGEALLPMVMVGATAVPVATPYIQSLTSKTVIAAGATAGFVALTAGGKALWNWFDSSESARNDEKNSDSLKTADVDTQKMSLSGTPKEIFKTYRLMSDLSGELNKITPREAMDSGLVRIGSEIYKTNGYLTFSLPPQKKMSNIHQIGVVKKIKKGINNISFGFKSDTGNSKCTIFSLKNKDNEDVLKLSKKGGELIIWDNGKEEVKIGFFMDITKNNEIEVTVNRELTSFVDINVNKENIYTKMHNIDLKDFFVGINCEDRSKYIREVSIKDLTT